MNADMEQMVTMMPGMLGSNYNRSTKLRAGYTTTPLALRKARRRAKNKAARASRKANR